jgi:hypothetical protein
MKKAGRSSRLELFVDGFDQFLHLERFVEEALDGKGGGLLRQARSSRGGPEKADDQIQDRNHRGDRKSIRQLGFDMVDMVAGAAER